jgi:glycosyltransferase involved in cell wall biosynthesis
MNSAYATAALGEAGATVSVLSRKAVPKEHYRDLFGGIPHTLHPEVGLPDTVWYAKLTNAQIRETLTRLAELHQRESFALAIFSGWNEFFPRLALRHPRESRILNELDSYYVDYSPHIWLRGNRGGPAAILTDWLKRKLMIRVLRQWPRLRFLVMDERVFDPALSALPVAVRSRFLLLPDPGPWSPENSATVSKPEKELLVVGRQSRRKGLEDVLAVIQHPEFPAHTRVRLVGQLGEDVQHLRPVLQKLAGQRLVWEDTYLSDAEIRQRYAASDFVLIPYTQKFHSTSAVLAWACAYRKPVISTAHGVVGYRVAQRGLGAVYPSGDSRAFLTQINRLPGVGSGDYATLQAACERFAAESSVEVFKKQLADHLRPSLAQTRPAGD